MLNSISERRIRLKNKYRIYLEVPEKEFLTAYDERIDVQNATDILSRYLTYHQDDARIQSVEVKHDKNNHRINIQADLYYTGNNHTEQHPTPPYLNH